jgi:hypothetical protein
MISGSGLDVRRTAGEVRIVTNTIGGIDCPPGDRGFLVL